MWLRNICHFFVFCLWSAFISQQANYCAKTWRIYAVRTEVSEPSAGGAGGECEVQAQIWPNHKQEPMRASSTPSVCSTGSLMVSSSVFCIGISKERYISQRLPGYGARLYLPKERYIYHTIVSMIMMIR